MNNNQYIIDDMKNKGVRQGSLLEIAVYEGAEYFKGYAPVDVPCYYPCIAMNNKLGDKLAGYYLNSTGKIIQIGWVWDNKYNKTSTKGGVNIHVETIQNWRLLDEVEKPNLSMGCIQ